MLPGNKICGRDFWFILHAPIMVLVAVISIVALLVILAENGWKWVSVATDGVLVFVHSIFGIVAISLIVLQVNFKFEFLFIRVNIYIDI